MRPGRRKRQLEFGTRFIATPSGTEHAATGRIPGLSTNIAARLYRAASNPRSSLFIRGSLVRFLSPSFVRLWFDMLAEVQDVQYKFIMSLFNRFFGKPDADSPAEGQLVANPEIKDPLSLQVLFPTTCPRDSEQLTRAFRSFHNSMAGARCEFDPAMSREGKTLGIIGWGTHVIRCVGFDLPMPAKAVESCIAPSHFSQEMKERGRSHRAHMLLFYAGFEASPLEQYVALAATAGVLASFDALMVLNESGHTAFPAAALTGRDCDGDIIELLRTLPLPILYCGFVKHEVKGILGIWMRTYGAPLLGLPDLSIHAAGHEEGERYFEIFEGVLRYLYDSEATLAAGHTMQLGEEHYLRVREPREDETFLSVDEQLFVVEIIGAEEINR